MPDAPSFTSKLRSRCNSTGAALCVGLDPDPALIPPSLMNSMQPPDAVRDFCLRIVDTTADMAAAFKLNIAFFEAIGQRGPEILASVLDAIPPDVLTIADAKRGDIGNSAKFYATAFLEDLSFDSITVAPYMGSDSVLPFLAFPGKAAFVLARTSNPGGNDFQLLESNGIPLYQRVARSCLLWEAQAIGCIGLVAGATDLDSLSALRHLCPETPLLIPGVGAQGASAEDVIRAAGSGPLLVNSSRKIIYASAGDDFAHAAGSAARRMHSELARFLTP
jgi:orotidine-5'-phosphate decarboxylase